jgi:curved DNA-binding protein CbpA
MAAAPPIPGVASLDLAPLMNRDFDPTDAGMTPEDYFVLTRCDGRTSFKQICTIAGFPEPQTMAILAKLREVGAILLPGEPPPGRRVRVNPSAPIPMPTVPPAPTPPSVRPRASATLPPRVVPPTQPPTQPSAARQPASPTTAPPAGPPPRQVNVPPEVLAEAADLSEEQKRLIYSKHALMRQGTLFDLLEVFPDADRKALKRAYFKISKDFHPDRFYGKKLGSFQQRLAEIFKAATDAFELLDDDGKREQYLLRLRAGHRTPPGGAMPDPAGNSNGPQSRSERAAELFEQACQHEASGDVARALREFSAAIQLDPLPRYLRRAVEACLRASELRSAEEYVKKFAGLSPRDASAHRMVAKVLRAQGRNQEAITELELASRLDPENVHIAAELEELQKLNGA